MVGCERIRTFYPLHPMMACDVVRMIKRVLSDLRQMFGFALDRDYMEADPTARIKKAKIGPDGERDHMLS